MKCSREMCLSLITAVTLGSAPLAAGCGGDAREPEEPIASTTGGEHTVPPAEGAEIAPGETEPRETDVDAGPDGEADAEGLEGEEIEAEADADAQAEAPAEEPLPWRQRVGAGRAVFARACGVCHPGGEEDIGPDIRGLRMTVEQMTYQIRNGSGRMRPIPERKLPERYMDELMAFLAHIGSVRGVER